MSEDEYHRPVQAPPEVMADLWEKVDELSTEDFTKYVLGLGLTPPHEPAGFKYWQVVISYPESDSSEVGEPELYWWGPEDDEQGEESDYDTLVVAPDEVLTDLSEKFETTHDSRSIVVYAAERGVFPPSEPEGYDNWSMSMRHRPGEEVGHLYWVGPHTDHSDEMAD